jgi:hypothetical protein
MAIGHKVNFLLAVSCHPLQEGLKHLTVEPAIDDHKLGSTGNIVVNN